MKSINTSSSRVQSQLCLTAAAIAGAAVGFENKAEAALVTTFQNTVIPIPASTAGVYLNFITGATGTSGGAVAGWDFNPYLTGVGLGFYWATLPASSSGRGGAVETALGSNLAADMAIGSVVGPAASFTSAIQSASANYRDTGISYLGFRFGNASNAITYGYARISTSASNGFPASILGWVYDDAGAEVTVTPAPGAAGLLTVLAAGAMSRRRKVA